MKKGFSINNLNLYTSRVTVENPLAFVENSIWIDSPNSLNDLHYKNSTSNSVSQDFLKDEMTFHLLNRNNLNYPSSGIGNPGGEVIDNLVGGKLVVGEGSEDVYFENKSGQKILIPNLASGVKSLLLLKNLISSGLINQRTLVVIDEVETNEHPAWQVEYVKILADLVQAGYTFLINTHSPYILTAVSSIFEERDLNHLHRIYQMIEDPESPKSFMSVDRTEDTEPIFADLAKPYARIL